MQNRCKRRHGAVTVWLIVSLGVVIGIVALGVDGGRMMEERRRAQTAADGASRAQQAGFNARGTAAEAAPAWKGIVKAADEHDASLIVLGSHGRTGLASVLIGSVAEAVAAHSRRSVLIIHRGDRQERTEDDADLSYQQSPA